MNTLETLLKTETIAKGAKKDGNANNRKHTEKKDRKWIYTY